MSHEDDEDQEFTDLESHLEWLLDSENDSQNDSEE
jgi:hypothetical protein